MNKEQILENIKILEDAYDKMEDENGVGNPDTPEMDANIERVSELYKQLAELTI